MPESRIRVLGDGEVRADRDYVLYWMVAARRPHYSHALDRALELAKQAAKPLLVFEPLRVGYDHASDRLHTFVLQGMADHRAHFAAHGVRHLAYVEPEPGAGAGLLEALAERACAIVTDDYPCFFLPRMVDAAADRLANELRFETVDGNGLYPIRAVSRTFTVAHSFRRHLQKELTPHLVYPPHAEPLLRYDGGLAELPNVERWGEASDACLAGETLSELPIDHDVPPVDYQGGFRSGAAQFQAFLSGTGSRRGGEQLSLGTEREQKEAGRLSTYHLGRNDPDDDAASGLSPWLHFGHVGTWQIFDALVRRDGWSSADLGKPNGKREGWWNMSPEVEAFLDELITWRELGFNVCASTDDYDQFDALPAWAKKTLADHAGDPRPELYTLEQLENALTEDDVWNAAQRQLRVEGRIHNYLRMLWGKKIFEWSQSPREAAERMIYLNDRYAVDGRDPNSYSGIFWVLGRHDRAWGPERPIYGKIRYMTSQSARRKLKMSQYLARWR